MRVDALGVRVVLIAVLIGCSGETRDEVLRSYGWHESEEHGKTIEEAVKFASDILQDEIGIRLRAHWQVGASNAIAVYALNGVNLSKQDIVFVPEGERFIVVNVSTLTAFLNTLASESDHAKLLCVVLLHEVGHIVNGDSGSYTGSEPISLELINAEQTPEKNRELAADRFAAEQLRDAIVPGGPNNRFVAGLQVASALAMVNFRLSTTRILENYGSSSPAPFKDRGYSHPNLELRLLIISHILEPNAASTRLVEDFLHERARGIEPRRLFINEPSD